MTDTRIRREFEVHLLNEEGIQVAEFVSKAFSNLLDTLEQYVGKEGREMAIACSKLEEASFYAKRANALNPHRQAEPK